MVAGGWVIAAFFIFLPMYRVGMYTNAEYLEARFGVAARVICALVQVQYRTSVLAIIGAIIGEFVGAEHGLGNVILITSSQLNMAVLFAALVMLTVMSLILFGLLVWAEKVVVWWRGL